MNSIALLNIPCVEFFPLFARIDHHEMTEGRSLKQTIGINSVRSCDA